MNVSYMNHELSIAFVNASLSTFFVVLYPYPVLREPNMMVVRLSGATSLRDSKLFSSVGPMDVIVPPHLGLLLGGDGPGSPTSGPQN